MTTARLRQHGEDRADVHPVRRHLVGHARTLRAPALRAREIFLSERVPLLRRMRARPVGERPSQARAFGHQHFAEVVKFARAFDLRMRGEDLFRQRRAGARQAGDEDDFVALRRFGTRGWRRIRLQDRIELGAEFGCVVRFVLRSQCVTGLQFGESGREITRVFLRDREREMDRDAIALGDIGTTQHIAHRHNVIRCERHRLELREIPPRRSAACIDGEDAAVLCDRFIEAALRAQDFGERSARARIVRLQIDRALQRCDCRLPIRRCRPASARD